jgi:hypothetical protein
MTKAISSLVYFEIFYVDGYLIIGNKFTYSSYKGGKTENKREKLLSELPNNIRDLVDLNGCIDQSLTNRCSSVEDINHKPKTINHKTKNINHKSETINPEKTKKKKTYLEQLKDQKFIDLLKEEFPEVDLKNELRAMVDWIKAKGRENDYKDFQAFARNWLRRTAKEQAVKAERRMV